MPIPIPRTRENTSCSNGDGTAGTFTPLDRDRQARSLAVGPAITYARSTFSWSSVRPFFFTGNLSFATSLRTHVHVDYNPWVLALEYLVLDNLLCIGLSRFAIKNPIPTSACRRAGGSTREKAHIYSIRAKPLEVRRRCTVKVYFLCPTSAHILHCRRKNISDLCCLTVVVNSFAVEPPKTLRLSG